MVDICGFALDKEATTKRFFDICDFYDIKNKDLVNLFNISNATVSYWRNGTRFPDWDKLMLFAYTVRLPLYVIIIGKKTFDDEKIAKAISNISKLKQEKYVSELQKLLDSGKLDFPPMISEAFFNPLINNSMTFDFDTTIYNQLIADVRKYGLSKKSVKNNSISKTENIFDMLNENSNSKNFYEEDNQETLEENDFYPNFKNIYKINLDEEIKAEIELPSEFCGDTSENLFTQNSSSLYIHTNGKDSKNSDEYDNPLNGWRIDEEAYDNHGKTIILRFRNGYLDGDEFDEYGKYLGTRPAVETVGYIEYWRKGCLHRDGKQPAVISNGFRTFEFWKKGKRIK